MNTFQTFFQHLPQEKKKKKKKKKKVARGIHGALLLPCMRRLPCFRSLQRDLHCGTAREQLVDK